MTESELRDELDEPFLRKQWRWQRVGWALMAIIIALAFLGILGTSPLAAKVVTQDVGGAHYEVEYSRWTRFQLLDRMHVRVHAPGATGDELKVSFSREWVENNNVRGSTPEADGGGFGPDGATYTFQVEDWMEPMSVAFEFEPRKAFRNPGELRIAAGEGEAVTLPIGSWVHP